MSEGSTQISNAGKFLSKSVVITLSDPDLMPAIHQEKGTIEWRTDNHRYPNFEVTFEGLDPEGGIDRTFIGSVTSPIVLKLVRVNPEGEVYRYTVSQYLAYTDLMLKGHPHKTTPIPFRVVSCHPCYP